MLLRGLYNNLKGWLKRTRKCIFNCSIIFKYQGLKRVSTNISGNTIITIIIVMITIIITNTIPLLLLILRAYRNTYFYLKIASNESGKLIQDMFIDVMSSKSILEQIMTFAGENWSNFQRRAKKLIFIPGTYIGPDISSFFKGKSALFR